MALAARRKDRLDALVERIDDAGGRAVAVEADVADEAQARSLVADASNALGGPRLPGQQRRRDAARTRPGGRDARMAYGRGQPARAALLHPRRAVPVMRDGGGGDIVNVASVAGRTARMGLAAYNMTKWGVVGFSEALRQGAASASASAASRPGYVDTELQGHNKTR